MGEDKRIIQSTEIRKFMNYFSKHMLNEENANIMAKMKNSLALIFEAETRKMGLTFSLDSAESDILLDFISDDKVNWAQQTTCDRVKDSSGNYVDAKPRITINNYMLYKRLKNSEPPQRVDACKDLLKNLFHEFQHYRQYLQIQSKWCSKEGIQFARDWVLSDSGLADPQIYCENYGQFLIENDANEAAYIKYNNVMGQGFSKDDISLKTLPKIYAEYSYDFGSGNYEVGERNDMSVKFLDDLIVNQGKTDLLYMYPILQREYNLDGTKKNTSQLIVDMRSEIEKIKKDSNLLLEEKNEITNNTYEMYYELIYRSLQNNLQMTELYSQFGEKETKKLIDDMTKYFERQKEEKTSLIEQQEFDSEKFVFPADKKNIRDKNNRRTQIIKDGKKVVIIDEEFVELLDNEKMQQMIQLGNGAKVTFETVIKRNCDRLIPESGEYVLKDGTIVSTKTFIEDYMFNQIDLSQDESPGVIIDNFIKQISMSKTQADKILKARDVEIYYDGKINMLKDIESLRDIKNDNNTKKGPMQVYDEKGNIIIHEFINPTLLERNITLPTGNEISAKQFIQENFAPHIPESGTFKLKNGIEISARQYIEEFVMFELDKYNGDLEELMRKTLETDDVPPEIEPDSKAGRGLGLKQENGVNNIENTAETTAFKESLETVSEENKDRKINMSSFKASLESKRKEHRTGQQDVNKSRNIIALRRERDRLSRGENLSEEQTARLNQINDILAGQQQFEQQGKKKSNGITR